MTRSRTLSDQQRSAAYDMWVNKGYNDREVAEKLGWSNTKAYDVRTHVFNLPANKRWGAKFRKKSQ